MSCKTQSFQAAFSVRHFHDLLITSSKESISKYWQQKSCSKHNTTKCNIEQYKTVQRVMNYFPSRKTVYEKTWVSAMCQLHSCTAPQLWWLLTTSAAEFDIHLLQKKAKKMTSKNKRQAGTSFSPFPNKLTFCTFKLHGTVSMALTVLFIMHKNLRHRWQVY